jgi:DNA-binding MarR family transcriptional regulator
MNIAVIDHVIATSLDLRERVIVYLAALPPCEPGAFDAERTTDRIARTLGSSTANMYRTITLMEAERLIRSDRTYPNRGSQRGYTSVWSLTEDGRKLAEAIRERMT